MTVRGVGVDLADVGRVARLVEAHGDRFVGKWFHPDEIAACERRPDGGRAYAEHFAVKEAVWKALGVTGWDGPLAWRSIVYRPGGAASVELQGRARAVADRAGTGIVIHATVTSLPRYALAAVLVTVRERPR